MGCVTEIIVDGEILRTEGTDRKLVEEVEEKNSPY